VYESVTFRLADRPSQSTRSQQVAF